MANIGLAASVLAKRLKGRKLPTVDVPQLPEPELNRALEGIKEHLRMYEGDSGAPKERFVTIAELEDAGIVTAQVKNKFAYIAEVQGVPVSQASGSTDPTIINQTIIQGGSGGVDTLFALTDTNVASQTQKDFLYYRNGKWINYPLLSSDVFISGYWTHTNDIEFEDAAINWANSVGTPIEFLKFSETPAAPPQPEWANVQFLADFDGTDGQTSYTTVDSNSRALTNTASALEDTQVKFGTTSAHFNSNSDKWVDGNDDGALGDSMVGAVSWCVEGWIYNITAPSAATSGGKLIFASWNALYNHRQFALYVDTSGEVGFKTSPLGTNAYTDVLSTGASLDNVNQWDHVAASYDGTTLRLFANGAMVYEAAHNGVEHDSSAHFGNDLYMGALVDFPNPVYYVNEGYIDDVRVTVGEALYTESFTLPTVAFPIGTGGTPAGGYAAFYVGDPQYPLELDGLTTNINSASTVIDGTLNVDGAATFNDLVQTTDAIIGDPGSEGTSISVNNVSYETALKVSDLGGADESLIHMHRHSTTLPCVLIGSRAKDDTASHTIMADNDILMTFLASGWTGSTYSLSSEIRFEVDGTPAVDGLGGQLTFMTAADGTDTPLPRMKIRADGSVEFVDATGAEEVSFSHDGTDFNIVGSAGTTNIDVSGAAINATQPITDTSSGVRLSSGFIVDASAGTNAGLYLKANGAAADDGNWDVSALTSGLFRIATATDIDGSGNNAIAINRTGIVVDDITLGADTDIAGALTATSYGGITEANLLDKTAAESLSGLWSFVQPGGALKDMMRWRDSTDAEDLTLHYDGANFELRSENDGAGNLYMQFTGGGSGAVAFGGAITATSYGGILQANLLDKTATETVSGTYTFTGPITGTAVASGLTNGLNLESLTPGIWFNETDAPANELGWKMYAATGAFNFYTTTDAGSSSDRIFHVDRTGVTVDQFVFDVPLLVSDVADFSSDVDINGGSSLFIKNGADSVEFAHDGTNLNIVGTNTTRLDFEGMSILDLQGPNMRIRSALESANYMTLDHDGTDFNMVGTGTTDWNITGLTGALLVSDIDTASGALTLGAANTVVAINGGDAFRVQNAGETDWAQFSHNGTDFNTAFTNTVDWDITGLTGAVYLGILKLAERAAATTDDAGRGQIWVKDTTPNELWFTDDAGTDFHLNTAQATAVNSQLKVLDTTTSRTSTTTLADQTGLSGFEVLANTFYSFEAVIFMTTFTIPDFKFDFQHSNAPANFVYSYMYVDSTGDTTGHEYGTKASSETIIVDTDGGGVIVRFSGVLKGHATLDSVMDFQWAQNTSSGSATTVLGGSWIRIERTA